MSTPFFPRARLSQSPPPAKGDSPPPAWYRARRSYAPDGKGEPIGDTGERQALPFEVVQFLSLRGVGGTTGAFFDGLTVWLPEIVYGKLLALQADLQGLRSPPPFTSPAHLVAFAPLDAGRAVVAGDQVDVTQHSVSLSKEANKKYRRALGALSGRLGSVSRFVVPKWNIASSVGL